jgi:glycosyltransferase involved in cell wall biosynthesis
MVRLLFRVRPRLGRGVVYQARDPCPERSSRLRIILHGRCFQDDSAYRGVGRYARGLLLGLAALPADGFEVGVALERGAPPCEGSLAELGAGGALFGAPVHEIEFPRRELPWWRRGRVLDAGLASIGADVFHLPAQFYAYYRLRFATPSVITVHDLIPFLEPASEHERKRGPRRLRRLAQFCRRARRVITLSDWVREQCVEHLGLDPERVAAIPPGVEPHFGPEPGDDAAVLRRRGLERPFFLYVGGDDPHKNLGGLLEAFRRFQAAEPGLHELVLVGRGEGSLPVEPGVRWLGFVDDAELPALYRGARAFLSLSRHEGFGLPLVEAMACGTPVVAARRAAVPETVGGAGLLVDPEDPAEAARCLGRLAREPALRSELRERGLERAAGFRWDRAAEATLEVYRSAWRPPSRRRSRRFRST